MSRACKVGATIVRDARDWELIQKALGVSVDAWPGEATLWALKERLGLLKLTTARKAADKPLRLSPLNDGVSHASIPSPDAASMRRVYGKAGDEGYLVRFKMPFPMKLYSRDSKTVLNSHRCHKLAKNDLEEILSYLLETQGYEWIKRHGLDVYGGCFNYRKTRGGSSLSKHAWGAAIDLNPNENRNRQKWAASKIGKSGYATMPLEAIKAFEKWGWKSGARAWGRDAMHFQRTR